MRFILQSDSLFRRSPERRWCCSPWQTVPVNVEGKVTVCDCQPERIVGDLLNQSLAEIWNGEMMMAQRRDMLAQSPPAVCSICPRF